MNKDNFFITISFVVVLIFCVTTGVWIISCASTSYPVEVQRVDTIYATKIVHDTLYIPIIERDSVLENEYNKLREQYIINEYKLERIRYYNKIAAKGNNIKFLRGWINRVLDN